MDKVPVKPSWLRRVQVSPQNASGPEQRGVKANPTQPLRQQTAVSTCHQLVPAQDDRSARSDQKSCTGGAGANQTVPGRLQPQREPPNESFI